MFHTIFICANHGRDRHHACITNIQWQYTYVLVVLKVSTVIMSINKSTKLSSLSIIIKIPIPIDYLVVVLLLFNSSSNKIQQLLDIIDPRYCDMSNGFSYKVFGPTIDGKQVKKRGFFGLKPLVSNTFVSDELDVF